MSKMKRTHGHEMAPIDEHVRFAHARKNTCQLVLISVLLEMVNFHNYGDFQGVLVRKNYGEFTMDIMVNFALNRIYSKFYRKCCISDHTPHFLV